MLNGSTSSDQSKYIADLIRVALSTQIYSIPTLSVGLNRSINGISDEDVINNVNMELIEIAQSLGSQGIDMKIKSIRRTSNSNFNIEIVINDEEVNISV